MGTSLKPFTWDSPSNGVWKKGATATMETRTLPDVRVHVFCVVSDMTTTMGPKSPVNSEKGYALDFLVRYSVQKRYRRLRGVSRRRRNAYGDNRKFQNRKNSRFCMRSRKLPWSKRATLQHIPTSLCVHRTNYSSTRNGPSGNHLRQLKGNENAYFLKKKKSKSVLVHAITN